MLAKSYAQISANANYDPSFVSNTTNVENNPIDFSTNFPNNTFPSYNHPISENEVIQTIARCSKKSAPGIDQITSTMLQHLHNNAISYFTSLLNRIFFSASFPSPWKIALVFPNLKPLKDPTHPRTYWIRELLQKFGLRGPSPSLIQNYLNNRIQCSSRKRILFNPSPRKWHPTRLSTKWHPLLNRNQHNKNHPTPLSNYSFFRRPKGHATHYSPLALRTRFSHLNPKN